MARVQVCDGAWRRFLRDGAGSIAPIFGVAALAIVTLAGVTIDYSRIENTRAVFQQSTDSAALALAMDRAAGLKDASLTDMARSKVSAQLPAKVSDFLRTVTVGTNGTKVTITTTATVSNAFGGILGKTESTIQTVATADAGIAGTTKAVEIALVYDLANGMKDKDKLTTLRKQTEIFLDTARRVGIGSDALRIAMIPFSEQVKLGLNFRGAPWLSFGGKPELPELTPEQKAKVSTDPRIAARLMIKAGQLTIDRPAWEGCVADAGDATDLTFDAVHPHPGAACQSQEWQKTEANAVAPLTPRFDQLKQKLAGMQPEGCENTAIGAVWGLAALTPQGPFGPAADWADKQARKIMIIVSGAPNSANRHFGICTGHDPREARMTPTLASTCDKIKAKGVTLYTINLIDGDKDTLKACASDPQKSFEAKTAGDLAGIMEILGKETLIGAGRVARLVN